MTDADPTGHGAHVALSAATLALGLGDPAGDFAALYASFHDGIRRTLGCLGVPQAAIDDALQEVFVVVHRRLDDPARFDSVKGWLYGIARRIAWRHHRSASRTAHKLARIEPPADGVSPELELERREAIAFMHGFLATLDEDQREVFVLAEIEGLTAPEIATVVEAKLNTVYSRLRLARARFEHALQRQQARTRREASHGT